MSAEERETFDARLIINKAVSSSCGKASLCGSGIFEERRVEGCAALQFKVHKNLLGGEDAWASSEHALPLWAVAYPQFRTAGPRTMIRASVEYFGAMHHRLCPSQAWKFQCIL